jgi:hypothetical protein
MMDHMYVSSNKYLHLYGALFVFGVLDILQNAEVFHASQSPAGAPTWHLSARLKVS